MSELLLSSSQSLIVEMRNLISRAKTLAAVRQLEPTRNRYILQFLYESKLINYLQSPVDLSDGNFSNIDMSGKMSFHNATLANGVHLINSSFMYRDLDFVDFHRPNLININFKFSSLSRINFQQTALQQADFSSATFKVQVDFNQSNLT
ncbi:unnamed protein product [Didymodactylos carnosus]|uniref:Pentapeptide repeat-containing protein n=1 Tax=Didymodactylos carnosus TaxID=1234261 RepID=A0A814I948_9BILA|nr:unnamed protein product [Didymodactylos carnosus]CAF1020382.1 unnamed protein product [Didymodactylos carnosus]CAF3691049.1 unnamed protein product [Didymodactylos carnosus]CAF3791802.1 unnamed protein product [Didymodactylos carnosus]